MKVIRHPKNPFLQASSKISWQASGIFNPSVVRKNGKFIMLFRATAKTKQLNIRGTEKESWNEWRTSSIGYAESKNGIDFEIRSQPLIRPEYSWEKLGCEDPRISEVNSTYYIFYTAVSLNPNNDRLRVRVAAATTKDFKNVKKHGVVGPNFPDDNDYIKAATLIPEKIGGKTLFLFTYHSDSPQSTIFISKFKNFSSLIKSNNQFWKKFIRNRSAHMLIGPSKKIRRGPEVGATPIKTEKGWLFIYCGESKIKRWTINAVLLDLKNPTKVIGKISQPILKPEKSYERKGIVNAVTFPEGAVVVKDKLYIYYGAADKGICLATVKLQELLDKLLRKKPNN